MPDEEWKIPPPNRVTDTRKPKVENDADYWKDKAAAKRAEREAMEEEKRLARLGQEPPAPPESPFTVEGKVNLGTFDLQEQQRVAKQEVAEERQAANERITQLEAQRDALKDEATNERIKTLQVTFQGQMDRLLDAIKNKGEPASIKQQFAEIRDLAKDMGIELGKPGAQLVQDPNVSIKLAEMQFEREERDRAFQREMKESDRKWELQLQELKDNRDFRKMEIEQKSKQFDMIAKAPEVLGRAIVKGMMDNGAMGGSGSAVQAPGQFHIEALEGDAGETDCPQCHTAIAIGKTAAKAVCSKCGLPVPIIRSPRPVGEPQPPPQVAASPSEDRRS